MTYGYHIPSEVIEKVPNHQTHGRGSCLRELFTEPPSASSFVPSVTVFAATSATVMNDQTVATLISERLSTSIRQDVSAKVFTANNELQLIAQLSP